MQPHPNDAWYHNPCLGVIIPAPPGQFHEVAHERPASQAVTLLRC
jgi:hypothetical protein